MKLPKPKTGSDEFIVPEDGVYRCELTQVKDPEPSRFANDAGEFPLRFEAVWTIRDEESEYDGVTVREWFNFDSCTHEKSKFYPFLKALLGRDYDEEEDEDLDLEDFVGKHVMLTLTATTKKDGRVFSKPTGAAPIRKKKATAPPPPKKKAVEPDEDEDAELWDEDAA